VIGSAFLRALLHGSRVGRKNPNPICVHPTDGVRASQLQHPVQDMNGDADLGRPTLILARAKPVTDDLLVAPDGGLNAAPFVIGVTTRFVQNRTLSQKRVVTPPSGARVSRRRVEPGPPFGGTRSGPLAECSRRPDLTTIVENTDVSGRKTN
jgi:hypothetical protein